MRGWGWGRASENSGEGEGRDRGGILRARLEQGVARHVGLRVCVGGLVCVCLPLCVCGWVCLRGFVGEGVLLHRSETQVRGPPEPFGSGTVYL